MVITSVSNPKIKELTALNDKKVRAISRTFIVEGINIVKDIPPEIKIREYIAIEGVAPELFCARDGVEIVTVSASVFDRLSDVKTPQGVAAVAEIPDKELKNDKNALILDRVRDPGNVGTLLRSAAAFGFFNAVLIDCADAFSQKALRSSMGGIFRLNVAEVREKDVFGLLHKEEYQFLGLDTAGEEIFKYQSSSQNTETAKKIALVVGNEADGISDWLLSACDKILSIKMSGQTESLNAATAGAIAMHAFFQKKCYINNAI
jgi:TrmH family RNA methyltransferase